MRDFFAEIGDRDTLKIAGFSDVYLGKNIYELTLSPTPYLTATGSAVATDYFIPVYHRLVRTEVKHTDSSDADATGALTWFLSREVARGLFEKLISEISSNVTDFIDEFGEGYEFPSMKYRFSQNTTNTDRIYLKLIIQVLKP